MIARTRSANGHAPGPGPLDILERNVDAWIAARKAAKN